MVGCSVVVVLVPVVGAVGIVALEPVGGVVGVVALEPVGSAGSVVALEPVGGAGSVVVAAVDVAVLVAGAGFTTILGGVGKSSACTPGMMMGPSALRIVLINCSYVILLFSLRKASRQRIVLAVRLAKWEAKSDQEDISSELTV